MTDEDKYLSKITQFNSNFNEIGILTHREGEWLKKYSRILLNFMDFLDQLPLNYYGKNSLLLSKIEETGQILSNLGDYFTSIDIFQRMSARCLAAKNFYYAGVAFNSMGVTYNQLNLFDKAEVSFGWALRIYKKQLHDDLGSLVILNNYALSLIKINHWRKAEAHFEEVLKKVKKFPDNAIRNKLKMSKIDFIASIYQNKGKLYLHMANEAQEKKVAYKHFAEQACNNLNEAIQHQMDGARKIEAESGFAEALFFLDQFNEAERILTYLERKCYGEKTYRKLLANIYRRMAMLKLVNNDVDDSMDLCYRALETSLLFANPAEEMDVIDTFIRILRMSSKILFYPVKDYVERAKVANTRGQKIIDNLVEFLEKKDLYTGLHHSFNVCQLSMRMGEVILANEKLFGICNNSHDIENSVQLDVLGLAGMLHDIGKLQVPWAIINKILPLREEEWQLIKEHPRNGYRILDSFYLSEVGNIVIEHHERIDGSGYPWGRKKLSLMGAIVSLADAYEAMTTINRLYRQAKPKEVALAEVKSLSGIHFDTRAVKALVIAMS